MASVNAALALVDDAALREDVDRIAAAAGIAVVHAAEPSGRQTWTAAAAVLLDAAAARRCTERGLPRRPRTVVLVRSTPDSDDWAAALAVGAQRVLTLPTQDAALVAVLSEAAESADPVTGAGAVVAVVGGSGGAGASLLATALAATAADALLIDVDPWSGGLELAVGCEDTAGLRWPDLAPRSGRLSHRALREALPRHRGVCVLSGARGGGDIDAGALHAVIDAGRRGGTTVVCDLPRRSTAAVEVALGAADLVAMVVRPTVRGCAAAAALGVWVTAANPNVGVVVRGPSPGGLSGGEVARIVGLPLLAAMRPQPRVAVALERAGLRLGARSPLAGAARRVLAVLASSLRRRRHDRLR